MSPTNARDTTVHIHGCLNCRPDMVPDFTRDDPRYHSYSSVSPKCASAFRVMVDGVDGGYTRGVWEGAEGWALVTGSATQDVHDCPCGSQATCVEPRFGFVTVVHEGAY